MTYLDGFYYALGGSDCNLNNLNKCERYSLEEDSWENIADLKKPRYKATCVSIPKDGLIYVIGGGNDDELFKTIERYDAFFPEWIEIQLENPVLRYCLESCLLPDSNFILIFGGVDFKGQFQKECC